MSTIRKSFKLDGVLTDMTTVKLSSSDATYGVKRTDSGAVVVADNVSMTRLSTGVYEYTFTDPANDLTYTYSIEAVYGGETYWIVGSFAGPKTASGLTTLAAVKSYLGLSGTTYDSILTALVIAASKAIDKYCRRTFAQATHTEYYNGDENGVPTGKILLRNWPVASITSVHDDTDQPPTYGAGTLLDSSEYAVGEEAGLLRLYGGTFNAGINNVKVIYVAGYSPIPEDVDMACRALAADFFHRGQEGADGFSTENLGDESKSWSPDAWPPVVRHLLAPYRNHAI